MTQLIALGSGAAAGAVLRHYVTSWSISHVSPDFPYGTLIVNLVGSFLLGFLMVGQRRAFSFSPALRLMLTTGFCGSLTTFSTFSYETLALFDQGRPLAALLNLSGSVLLGLFCAAAGMLLAEWLL